MFRRTATIIGGTTAYGLGTIIAYIYFHDAGKQASDILSVNHKKRMEIYSQNVFQYDKDIDLDEKLMGLTIARKSLIKNHAKGKILEIASGTGRNINYYKDKDLNNVTFVDSNKEMLERLKEKISMKDKNIEKNILVMDAEHLNFPNEFFDSVIDTFGLCSMDHPVKVLNEMSRVCKKDGKILLLEHGKSYYEWLNFILNKYAHKHVLRWGCIWNRDILNIIERSELEIEKIHRFHFGTTYYIIARKKKTVK